MLRLALELGCVVQGDATAGLSSSSAYWHDAEFCWASQQWHPIPILKNDEALGGQWERMVVSNPAFTRFKGLN